MDQFDAENSGNKTFSLPLLRMRGDDDAKNLLINPGGPGGSGTQFIYRRGKDLSTIVGSGYHILGFDPRGVNGSVPVASCYPDKESRSQLSFMKSDYHPLESSRDTYAWTTGFVRACAESLGEHGKYINTPQTAADMNSILDAVGQDEMIYWGFSYGTVLGQAYAQLFPERSHRVMIDGVVDFATWFLELNNLQDSFTDTDKVMLGFFRECLEAGSNCPLSALKAKSAEELQSKVLDFAFKLEEPLSVYVNNSKWGSLKPEHIILNGIFPTLYKPEIWWTLADHLTKLLQGNATDAYIAWGGKDPLMNPDDTDSNNVIMINDALSGSQHWPQGRQDLLDMILPYINSSIFAPTFLPEFYKQQQWAIPRTHNLQPKKTVKTVHPLLILSSTNDPITPMASAKLARSIFQGSQIVERDGYGHCTIAMPSLCVAKHIRAFLGNGTVPTEQTKCAHEGTYFVKPNSTTISKIRHFESSEDEAIYQAQLEMARDLSWPYTR